MRPRLFAALLLSATLAGCAALPRERGYADTSAALQARVGHAPDAQDWAAPPALEVPREPLDAERALALAYAYNPRIRETYARIGLGRAELEAARRLANPRFGFARLRRDGGGSPKITRSLSIAFADLLLLPARKRFAAAELQRVQDEVASELLALSVEVESAWFEAVAARQVSELRALVAQASGASATLAQRFYDAGNLSRLQLEQERAAAAQARIAAARAVAEALRARAALATSIGLPAAGDWSLAARLPAPPATATDASALLPLAQAQRLDLAAATRAVAQHEAMLGLTRRWRWLGEVEVGFEQEREEGVSQGPTLALELPIFGQGQAAVARARAEQVRAVAQRDALALSVQNETLQAVQALNVAREVAEAYRSALLPAREAIVARSQEEVNYMLIGVFELLRARAEEYDAYQEYIEAVRDYWTARARLRGAVGGALPDDGAPLQPTIGVDEMLPAPVDHSMHGGHR